MGERLQRTVQRCSTSRSPRCRVVFDNAPGSGRDRHLAQAVQSGTTARGTRHATAGAGDNLETARKSRPTKGGFIQGRRSRRGQDWHGEHRLQHEAPRLLGTKERHGRAQSRRSGSHEHQTSRQNRGSATLKCRSSLTNCQKSGFFRVSIRLGAAFRVKTPMKWSGWRRTVTTRESFVRRSHDTTGANRCSSV